VAMPAFFPRVADSLRPVANVDPEVLADKLVQVRVRIELATDDPAAQDAFMLAANLAARLYPRIALTLLGSTQADDVATRARELILRINPGAGVDLVTEAPTGATPTEVDEPGESDGVTTAVRDIYLYLGTRHAEPYLTVPDATPSCVSVDATGWNVVVDPSAGYIDVEPNSDRGRQPGHPLAWLAAATIGMAEVFRSVFADELGERGRTNAQPGGFNLLTTQAVDPTSPPTIDTPNPGDGSPVDIGDVHLVGAGAIGQAAALALRHLNVTGTLRVTDPETVTMSNLQRYLLTDANSVGAVKVELVADALGPQDPAETTRAADRASTGALAVRTLQGRWGDSEEHLQADQVLVALDTARDRITVAATLPRHAYNAWTQVADLGWSRHEDFGIQPCLACLYYPDRARPSEHELIAMALNQPPLRVLAYLTFKLPIGYPLPGIPAVAELPAPPEASEWTQVALIEDLVTAGVIGDAERSTWANTTIGALYRDGICAGGLLPVGDLPGDVLVPLAHQSALAGIMLVAELLWSRQPELTAQRDAPIEHRYDVLRGFPQVVARPRQRTPHCLCSDAIYTRNTVESAVVGT
jgi:ThiF family